MAGTGAVSAVIVALLRMRYKRRKDRTEAQKRVEDEQGRAQGELRIKREQFEMAQEESRRQFVDNQEVQSMSAPVQNGLTPPMMAEINRRGVETFNNVEELVQEVRLCRTLNDYRNVHQHLSKHIEQVSDAIKGFNKDIERAERTLRRLYKKGIPDTSTEAAPIVAERMQTELYRKLYYSFGRMYRTVGDALAVCRRE